MQDLTDRVHEMQKAYAEYKLPILEEFARTGADVVFFILSPEQVQGLQDDGYHVKPHHGPYFAIHRPGAHSSRKAVKVTFTVGMLAFLLILVILIFKA